MSIELQGKLAESAWCFRGYNVTNLGRTPELLEHPKYGGTVEKHLKSSGELCEAILGRPIDLVRRVREREETTLQSYPEAIGIIVGAELAQMELLHQFHGIEAGQAARSLGYSLGEVSSLVTAGVYPVESLLTPILTLSEDCVDLAADVSMGIVFSRGPVLEIDRVERLCIETTLQGHGTVCVSSYLSPNTVLVLAQGDALNAFKAAMKKELPREVHIRKNPDRWPPIHTAIARQKNISDRAAVILDSVPGGLDAPAIPVVSCITGETSYNDFNSRSILSQWVDHPQQLWKVIEHLLNADVHTLIHVGPEPNIIPATFNRLSMNVAAQLNQNSLAGLGLRAVSSIVRGRPWLAQYLSKNAALLRAPLIEHIVLEDWLLENG